MPTVNFYHRLRNAIKARGFLIQGLDPVFGKIPDCVHTSWRFNPTQLIVQYLVPIIDTTAPYVMGFKPNLSFFVEFDDEANCKFWGQEALSIICHYIKLTYPDHVLILDAKDGDIGKSNNGYTKRAFVGYQADAVTWDPYLGTAIRAQAERYQGKAFIALARTSNSEGTKLQNLELTDGRQIFEATADDWLELKREGFNIGFVAGATHPAELAAIRKRVGAAFILIPGVGKQGGDAAEVARAGFGGSLGNMGINISSGSLEAGSGPAYAADAAAYMQERKTTIEMALAG